MAEKSKTVRAAMLEKGSAGRVPSCPRCGAPLVATKVVKTATTPGGMFWVCPQDDYRRKT